MPRLSKAKQKTSEKRVVGDGFTAILLIALIDTPSPNKRKNPRRVTGRSNVARTKNKSPVALPPSPEDTKNKSPVALPPSPEDGERKHRPEKLIEEDKKKQKFTTLWSRGKAKKVNVVNIPKDKDTGPQSNQNGISFRSQSAMKSAYLCCPCNARSAVTLKDMFLSTKLVNILSSLPKPSIIIVAFSVRSVR
jgi:hypothetical protein